MKKFFLFFFMLITSKVFSQELKDTIFFTNGSRLIGEIKKIKLGVMTFDPGKALISLCDWWEVTRACCILRVLPISIPIIDRLREGFPGVLDLDLAIQGRAILGNSISMESSSMFQVKTKFHFRLPGFIA